MLGMGWLVMVAIGLLVVYAVDRRPATTTGALQRLEERYARGEIDTEEFLTRRGQLEGSTR